MLANIHHMLAHFAANYKDIIVVAVIMVSAIIVAIGLLKPIIFNRIHNKLVRKAALALSNIAACFIATLILYLVRGWSLTNYAMASAALSAACIITYWLYENTCLRNLIGLVGGLALRKALSLMNLALTTDDVKAVKQELHKTGEELKAHTTQALKKTGTELQSYTGPVLRKTSSSSNEDDDLKRL